MHSCRSKQEHGLTGTNRWFLSLEKKVSKSHICAALLLMLTASTAFAQEEPWGGNVPGWRFTQSGESGGGVNCRAVQGTNLIARRSNGRTYVSVPAPAGLPKGWYREGRASIVMGSTSEPVDAERTGRLLLHIDDGLYPALIRARGFQWRVSGPKGIVTGSVSFSGDVAKAIAELRACVRANTAAAQPRPPQATTTNSKWSGVWSWVRPLVFNFGSGPAPQRPGPQDVTVRERVNASFELMPNNRVRICIASNPCGVHPFSFGNGAYNIDFNSGFIVVVANDQGRSLNGQFWWDKKNRTLTTPDATFALDLTP